MLRYWFMMMAAGLLSAAVVGCASTGSSSAKASMCCDGCTDAACCADGCCGMEHCGDCADCPMCQGKAKADAAMCCDNCTDASCCGEACCEMENCSDCGACPECQGKAAKSMQPTADASGNPDDVAVITAAGMSCPLCAANIERQLRKLPGYESMELNLDSGKLFVKVDPAQRPSKEQLGQAVIDGGFTLESVAWQSESRVK